MFMKYFLDYHVLAESLHLTAMVVLLLKLTITKSSSGVSGKTLSLLAVSYTFRSMNLWLLWILESWQITVLKILHMSTSYLALYLTYSINRGTVEWDLDTFSLRLVIIPVSVFSYVLNEQKKITQLVYTWSMFMESAAFLPQFFMLWKYGGGDTLVVCYILLFAFYLGVLRYAWVLDSTLRSPIANNPQKTMQLIVDVMIFIFGILGTVFATLGYLVENYMISSLPLKVTKIMSNISKRNPCAVE